MTPNADAVRNAARIIWADPGDRDRLVEMFRTTFRRDVPGVFKVSQDEANRFADAFVEQLDAELRRLDYAANRALLQ
jgi:hypothetical protein